MVEPSPAATAKLTEPWINLRLLIPFTFDVLLLIFFSMQVNLTLIGRVQFQSE
ncbi:hypothetical protein [Vibrio sp. S17_S38]|uniref:hypothetical protein n=1 Tax=Vibrio sp. S17_S38 TaxID=2720229 RepID=UPI001EEEFE37|nr:hypothetical protein [Vibrio sp. S17_S38]